MAADEPSTIPPQDRLALAQRNASEVGAMIAAQVRAAIDSAERSAEELQQLALAHAACDHHDVDRAAGEVLAQIDAVEAKLGHLLQDVRDQVTQIAQRANSPDAAPAATEAGVPGQPDRPELETADSAPPAEIPEPRGGRFKRRRRDTRSCDVCGRAPRADEQTLEQWQREARMSLCPDCQGDGWRLPAGGGVPYRATVRGGRG